MIIDSGYLIINTRNGGYYIPNNEAIYKTRKGAQNRCDFLSKWTTDLRVVKVNIVIDEEVAEWQT